MHKIFGYIKYTEEAHCKIDKEFLEIMISNP
mgnify:CR=1 FL=1